MRCERYSCMIKGNEPNLQEKMGFKINRDSWGHLYSNDRGEILGPFEDKLLRKHKFF